MRRVFIATVVAAVIVPAAFSSSIGGADVATGKGMAACAPGACTFAPRSFQFAATSNPHSGQAQGILRETSFSRTDPTLATGTITADVFCVSVNGPHAVVGAIVTESTGAGLPVGTITYVPADDLGMPGGTTPDLFGPNYLTGETTPVDVDGQCTLDFPALMAVVDGDVRVNDGQLNGGA
jgi:hypothetical protein